jgi:hypothetical protein
VDDVEAARLERQRQPVGLAKPDPRELLLEKRGVVGADGGDPVLVRVPGSYIRRRARVATRMASESGAATFNWAFGAPAPVISVSFQPFRLTPAGGAVTYANSIFRRGYPGT